MAFTQLPNKNAGDLIKSADWNEAIQELLDLRSQKLNHTNGSGTNLTINGPLAIGGNMSFGSQVRQMLHLWGTEYGFGVQAATLYSRSFSDFAWHRGGVHHDGQGNPGAGGTKLMTLNSAGDLTVSGIVKGRSYQILDTAGVQFPDAWIGMADNNIGDAAAAKWLHIGGITDGGTRRIALYATRTLVSQDLDVRGNLVMGRGSGNAMRIERDDNNMRMVMNTTGGFVLVGQPAPANVYSFDVGHWHFNPIGGFGGFGGGNSFITKLRINQDGHLSISGGKGGYVADMFINKHGDALEQGDVVVISSNQEAARFYGTDNAIPIPEVDLTTDFCSRRVCGIVSSVVTVDDLPPFDPSMFEAGALAPTGKPAKRNSKTAAADASEPTGDIIELEHPHKRHGAVPSENFNKNVVLPNQMGRMVTLGAFAFCKVDADIAPIEIGDLLTTSPTKGHAQKVTDPAKAVGAVIGKALAPLKKGRGKISVMVFMQ